MSISARDFYAQWSGHPSDDLIVLIKKLRADHPDASFVFFASDSSFDNKYWLHDFIQCRQPAVNGYEKILNPPFSKPDVCYQLNKIFAEEESKFLQKQKQNPETTKRELPHFICINTGVEATTLSERKRGTRLLAQDQIIRDYVTEKDVIVSSVGGNDAAFLSSCGIVCSIASLVCCTSTNKIREDLPSSSSSCSSFPYCFCYSCSNCSLNTFHTLLNQDYEQYLRALISRKKPKLVLPSSIYFPAESAEQESWAKILPCICYRSEEDTWSCPLCCSCCCNNTRHVQEVLDRFHRSSVSQIQMDNNSNNNNNNNNYSGVTTMSSSKTMMANNSNNNTKVVPVRLADAMNGKNPNLYDNRVEPSAEGGREIAKLVHRLIAENYSS